MKRLILLGASGSIGTQTIDVVLQHPDAFALVGISVGHRIDILKEILEKISVSHVCVCEEKDMKELAHQYPDIHFYFGDEGLLTLSKMSEYDLLVNALVGFVGFLPTLNAIQTGHNIALAIKITSALISLALKAAVVSVEKYGLPVPPPKITTLPFSK